MSAGARKSSFASGVHIPELRPQLVKGKCVRRDFLPVRHTHSEAG
jgi:hypothetical protein